MGLMSHDAHNVMLEPELSSQAKYDRDHDPRIGAEDLHAATSVWEGNVATTMKVIVTKTDRSCSRGTLHVSCDAVQIYCGYHCEK